MVVKRAMVHPGKVRSRNDGDIHWVTGRDLIALYRLNPATTVIATPDNQTGLRQDDFDHYYPRVDGKYEQH
jgi:hypothetical protein